MMVQRLAQTSLVVIVLMITVVAQDQQTGDPALQARARRLDPFIIASAQRYGIDARILRTVCFIESRYRTEVVSPKGARGPMQFMPETAARYGLVNPHEPRAAIDAAARYLRDLLQRFDGRVDLALAAYNAGEGAVTSFMTGRPLSLRSGKVINARGWVTGGVPPYRETQRYVQSALTLLRGRSVLSPKPLLKTGTLSPQFIPHAPKDFTLDALTHVQLTIKKQASVGPSSFIEIQ